MKSPPQTSTLSFDQVIHSLQQHGRWLAEPSTGERLIARGTVFPDKFNFRRANLRNAVFSGATLLGADFSKADLSGTSFDEANLSDARLHRSKLDSETKLHDAILRNADLTGCSGLNAAALGGADLTGAKLPENIAPFEILKAMENASAQVDTLFISVLGASAYTLLTVGSTKDAALVTNSTTSPLPVISTSILIASFYFIAPILLVLFFAYFHISLQRLSEMFADLPAVFPDGCPVDKRTSPRLLSGLVRSRVRLLSRQRPAFADVQTFISVLLAYTIVPVTLAICWARYLARHDWMGSFFQVGLEIGCLGIAAAFYKLSKAVLTRKSGVIVLGVWLFPASSMILGGFLLSWISMMGPWYDSLAVTCSGMAAIVVGAVFDLLRRLHIQARQITIRMALPAVAVHSFAAAGIMMFFAVLTAGSICGINPDSPRRWHGAMPAAPRYDPRGWVPLLWGFLRYEPFPTFGNWISRVVRAMALRTPGRLRR